MVTSEQVTEYLQSVGVDNVPSFIVAAWVVQLNSLEECLLANYDAGTAMLIQFYLVGLFGLAGGDKYISSQTAPSGASRSFRYGAFKDRWGSQLSLLRSLDTEGCTNLLLPADPTAPQVYGGLWTVRGSNMCRDR